MNSDQLLVSAFWYYYLETRPNFEALADFPSSFVLRFESDNTLVDLYELDPAEGTLLQKSPEGMFVDASIYWIERIRVPGQRSGTDESGNTYAEARFAFHRGGSTVAQNTFLGALDSGWSWVIINQSTQQWIVFPANQGGNFGSGFCEYDVTPSYITPNAATAGRTRHTQAVAESFFGGEAAQEFTESLVDSELIVALIPSRNFRPVFN